MCTDPYEALASLLNYSVKPCDDMYAHVCSRWIGNAEHVGFLQESFDHYLTRMHDIFETSDANVVGEGLSDGLRTGRVLFTQCLTAMKGNEVIKKDDMVFLTQKLLLTRVIESQTTQDALREGTEISFTFGLNGLLTLRPQRLDNEAVMYAFPGSAVKTYFPARADVKQCVSHLLTSMAIVTDVQTLATAVMSMDRVVAAHLSRARSLHKKIPAKQLGEESPTLEALVASPMERLTKMCSLSKGYVLVRDYENLVAFIRLLTQSSGLNISWYLVVQMLVDLLLFDYVARYELNDKWQALRACSVAVNKAVSNVWSSLSRQLMLNKTNHDPISDLLDGVRVELASNNSYVHEFLSGKAFSALQKVVRNISCVSNRELLQLQRKLVLGSAVLMPSHHSFVRSYVDVKQQARAASLTWPPGVVWDIAALLEMEMAPLYREETNSVFLSTTLEMPHVFYAEDSAHLLNYGVLGAALARELVLAVAPGSQLDTADLLWSSEATRQLLQQLTCYADLGIDHHEHNATDFRMELFPWLASVRVAYGALQRQFRLAELDNSKWKMMQRQFFLRFCLAACHSSSAAVLSARNKCIWPLSGNAAFMEAFDCPGTSPMSRHPCQATMTSPY
ncbi:hypothetical protein HPB52_006305 [Rhipicephalus sanguineus]|uniref:Uncharacterized protein n=1 Tax=Rhipicephalus sanguineus TaxID=34632 RepID=A0A9D4SU20_RHISA|nr:hypothetical protein HPB52_006305 [Rhipicephalus sanguineus]